MDSRFPAVTLLALAVACMCFPTGSANIVPRCSCRENTLLQRVALRNIVDYQIFPSDDICPTQIILTLKSGGGEVEACLSPMFLQGLHLTRCWERIQHNNERKKQCLQRKRP